MPFTPANSLQDQHLVVGIWGAEGSGKSHFALTFPSPIYYLNFDYGVRPLLPKFLGKDIQLSNIVVPDMDAQEGDAARCLEAFWADYKGAYASAKGGTVVVDTMSQVWDLIYHVKLNEVRRRRVKKTPGKDLEDVQVFPFDYSEANNLMAGVLTLALRTEDVHSVFIHKAKPVYNSQGVEQEGKIELQGWGRTPYMVDVLLQMRKDADGVHQAFVQKFRWDTKQVGYDRANLDYDGVMDMLPDAPPVPPVPINQSLAGARAD
jgi:hypothetical protein